MRGLLDADASVLVDLLSGLFAAFFADLPNLLARLMAKQRSVSVVSCTVLKTEVSKATEVLVV